MPERQLWCECCAGRWIEQWDARDRAALPWQVYALHRLGRLVSVAHTVGLWPAFEHPELVIEVPDSPGCDRLDRFEMSIVLETCAMSVSAGLVLDVGERWNVHLVEESLELTAVAYSGPRLWRVEPIAPIIGFEVVSDRRGVLTCNGP